MNEVAAHPDTEVQRSLRDSIRAGALTAIMLGAGENYVVAYGIFLGASAFQASLITTLPPLIGAGLVLFVLDRIIAVRNRSRFLERVSVAQGLLWFPMAVTYFAFQDPQSAVLFLLLCTIAHYSVSALANPTWNGLMGDLVPAESRGSYFGKRNRTTLFYSLLAMILSGAVLQWSQNLKCAEYGYFFLFLIAGLARLLSARLYGSHYEPGNRVSSTDAFTFREFLRRSHRSNFLKFTLFIGAFNLSVSVATPFITFYLLTALQMSYIEFTAVTSSLVVAQLIMMQRWGKLVDEFGAKKVLIFSCVGYSIVDFLWLVSSNFWVILVSRVAAGALWAGFVLSSASFLFDAVSAPKRARCNAYQTIINSVCVVLGTLLGGLLVELVPHVAGFPVYFTGTDSSVLLLFVVSGCMRLLALFFLVAFSEVRDVPTVNATRFMYRIIHVRPLTGPILRIVPKPRSSEEDRRD